MPTVIAVRRHVGPNRAKEATGPFTPIAEIAVNPTAIPATMATIFHTADHDSTSNAIAAAAVQATAAATSGRPLTDHPPSEIE